MRCNYFVPLRYKAVPLLALFRCLKYHEWRFAPQRLSWNLTLFLIPPSHSRMKAVH